MLGKHVGNAYGTAPSKVGKPRGHGFVGKSALYQQENHTSLESLRLDAAEDDLAKMRQILQEKDEENKKLKCAYSLLYPLS